MGDVGLLLAALVLILAMAELFTNALEHMGDRMGLSEGVTGSVFAAVGTAMPETIVPLYAILAGGAAAEVNEAIGIGAILGAPFMLATVALGLLALATYKSRGWRGDFHPEPTGLRRDLIFFFLAFVPAVGASLLEPGNPLRWAVAFALPVLYVVYLVQTFAASAQLVEMGHETEAEHPLMASKLGLGDGNLVTGLQLLVALGGLLAGAHLFVDGVSGLSGVIGMSPLILSLLIIPIATELPEKVNSVLWVRRGKDTLAFGNISGAMVFQGSLLPAIGIALTGWQATTDVLVAAGLTLAAAAWLFINQRVLTPVVLLFPLLCYVGFIGYVIADH
ncbi:MAG: sodium:proton exchanger [Alphaproteobacteria bacterium CG_4_10_14_0_2_um_filter_63_37]|nr:MAG: sodium:proton exchanger [Proteobacteria bacterium CG1_02_64_396]PJA24332.1 MAG: sodium:proton exchanger [Alphaproteobacteria bacterium CG_4_10_14_0_2_um_filter_63_37]